MGEDLTTGESQNSHEAKNTYGEGSAAYAREKLRMQHEKIEVEKQDVEAIAHKAEKHAHKAEDLNSKIKSEQADGKKAEDYAYSTPNTITRTLTAARKQLSPVSRQFSKIVHAPAIESVSDVLGGTVARPSGILWGGIFSFITTISVLGICKYYGYEFNQFIGLVSFAGGFVLGLLIELLSRLFKRPNKA